MKSSKRELIGFLIEIKLFMWTGYLLAKNQFIFATIMFILSMISAFTVGKWIYERGKEEGGDLHNNKYKEVKKC